MQNKTILIVENDAEIGEYLKLFLQSRDFTVLSVVATGEAALELIDEHHPNRPDLILMDMHLDGALDGVETCRLIHEKLDVPVVYLTAYSNGELLTRAKTTRPFAYVRKPFNEQELELTLSMALFHHQQETRLIEEIEQRKKAEKELAQKIQELDFQKSALDQHAIVSITDVTGRITYVNDKFCDISGYSRDELMGQNHRIVKSDLHTDAFYKDLWQTIASGKTWRGEIQNLKKGGGHYWVDATIVPFLNAKGKPFQYVAIRTNITERVKARDEAQAANIAKSQFLSSMSHELRTPLNAILGFSQLLSSDPQQPLVGHQIESVQHIIKGGEHLLQLINQVLDLAKIESGNLTLSLEDIDPAQTIQSCHAMTKAMARRRGVQFENKTEHQTLPLIFADHMRFKQILLNFLSNAVKYNKPQGRVELDSETVPGRFQRFLITDTGRGIPNKYLDSLFKPFHRLSAEGGEIEGTGIGLTITKELVHAMGGNLGFETQEGAGSTFWFELPLAQTTHGQALKQVEDELAQSPHDEDMPPSSKMHLVLYVEDNPANLELMTKIIGRMPAVDLISAHTAEIGLQLAELEQPELILMDINLPGMDGVQALRKLQKNPLTSDIPVIAVSAAAMPKDIERGLKAGFLKYLTKPIQVAEVQDAIQQILNDQA